MTLPARLENVSYLVIEANSTCNLACKTCNRSDLERQGLRKPKNISETEFAFVLDQLKPCPIDTIKFEGLSEPMLHPRFDRLTEMLRERFPKAHIIIASNLQYEISKTPFFKTLPLVDTVYLSIDGTNEIYEAARTGAKYTKLLRSLNEIEKFVSAEDRAKKLHINFTATPDNYRELPAMYELRDRYGLASVRINLAQNWNEHEKNKHNFHREMIEYLRSDDRFRMDMKGVPGWNYSDCFWPYSGIMIDVEGNLRQCIINTSQAPLGNAYQTPIRKIFENSAQLSNVRAALERNCASPSCETCDYHHLSSTLKEIIGVGGEANKPRPRPSFGTSKQ